MHFLPVQAANPASPSEPILTEGNTTELAGGFSVLGGTLVSFALGVCARLHHSQRTLWGQGSGHCQGSGQQDPLQLALLTSFLFTGAAMGKARPQAGCAMPVLAQCIPALLLGQVLQVGSESGAFPPLDLKSGGCLLPWIPACSLSGLSRSPNNLPRLHVTFINKLLCHLFMYSC